MVTPLMTHTGPYITFLEQSLPVIEQHLSDALSHRFNDERDELMGAMRYATTAGGKRMRPVLAMAAYRLFSEDMAPIMPVAVALELTHTYSLIHDDLPAMDNDSLRRGKPTCHIQFGEDMAILAGDTLNTYAFECLTHLAFPPDRVIQAIRCFANACGANGMSGGQVIDLKSHTHSKACVEQMHRLKTGALIEASLTLPALLAGAPSQVVDALRTFGSELGLLFQIKDDLLDVTGGKDIGKTPHKDTAQAKKTYCSTHGMAGAKQAMATCAQHAHTVLQTIPHDISILASAIDYGLTRTS